MTDFDPEIALLAIVAAPLVAALVAGPEAEMISDRVVSYGVAAALRLIAEAKAAVETARAAAVNAAEPA